MRPYVSPSTPQGNQCEMSHLLAGEGACNLICTSMLWSIDSCQNMVSVDHYHFTVSLVQVSTHRGYVFFKVSADKLVVFNGSQAQLYVDFFEKVKSLWFEKIINL